MCGVIGIALVSAAFTGTAVARMVGHNQNRYAMAAVGGIVAGALTALPLMGNFVSGVAFVFTLATPSRSSGATPTSSRSSR